MIVSVGSRSSTEFRFVSCRLGAYALALVPAELLVSAFAIVVLPLAAHAGGLSAPFSLDSAKVLPKGIRSFRIEGFSSSVTNRYDGNGSIVSLGSAFNKPVTYNDLEKSLAPTADNAVTIGGVNSSVSPGDTAGQALGVVNAQVTTTVPVFAYGVSDKLTVGLGVPILYANTSVSVGWDSNATTQALIDKFRQSGAEYKVQALRTRLMNAVATRVSDYGYQPLAGESHTDFGDTSLVAKYQVLKTPDWMVAVAPRVVLPTGRTPDIDKVVDIAPGDGLWDIGAGSVVEYTPTARFSASYSAYYMYQVPMTRAFRVPLDSSETISPNVDNGVNLKRGDMMGTTLAAHYQVHPLITLGTAYGLQYKAADAYSGSIYSQDRYNLLSIDSEQVMQTAQVGVSLSTVSLYQAGKFEVPFDVNVGYTAMVAGRNVNKLDLATLELVSFF